MNKMLKKLLFTLVAVLAVNLASAQDNRSSAEEASRMKAKQTVAELKGKLSLTNEQQKQTEEIMTYAEMKKASKSGLDSQIDIYVTEEMNKILTESQMQVYLRLEASKNPKADPEREHKE